VLRARRRALVAQPRRRAAALTDARVKVRARMPADLRRRHDGLVRAFLDEKQFAGCNGLTVTERCAQ
jgi:Mlc titration factor MtfA (ptsG expression regulator)